MPPRPPTRASAKLHTAAPKQADLQAYRLVLEYDGTRYSGWQEQKNARTVMGEVRAAAEAFLGFEVELGGSGRTDAGVHALYQVAHLKYSARDKEIRADKFLAAINDALPADIAVISVEPTDARFHARHHAESRRYAYQIALRKSAFSKKHVWWIHQPLDLAQMEQAAACLAGRHDFICFRAKDVARPDESTIVEVARAEFELQEPLLIFRIEASHFLWRMVRRIVGALVKVGSGELTVEQFQRLVDGECQSQWDVAAWTAPSSGLFLEYVRYGK